MSEIARPARPRTVAMVGSLPLSAPWNGADKVLARTIVQADTETRYLLATGSTDDWPVHVTPVRQRHPAAMPGRASELHAAAFLMRAAPQADLVHVVASQRRRSLAPMLLRAGARLAGLPIVHSLPALSVSDAALRPLGDVTVVFSEHTAGRLRAAGVPRVVSMFPPLPLDRLAPQDPSALVRERLGLGSHPVLYAGHLDEGGGIREAILAFARLPEDLCHATLALAVRWRPGQDPETEIGALTAVARQAGIADRLRWIRRADDMPSLIAACELTILVPRSLDGKMDLPLVLLESLALGRPIVIADRPPMTEALLGGGLAVPFGDPTALAAAVTTLLRDDATRRAMGAAGSARVRALADPDLAAARYRDIYEQALAVVPAAVRVT